MLIVSFLILRSSFFDAYLVFLMPHPPTRQMEAKSWSWTSASALGAYASRRQGTVVFGSGLAGPGVLGGLLAATWPIPWNGSSLRLRTFALFFQLEDL